MRLTVEDNSLQVAKNFEKQVREQPQIVKTALGRTAEFLMGIIKQRTTRGQNADGNSFPPYTEAFYMLLYKVEKNYHLHFDLSSSLFNYTH